MICRAAALLLIATAAPLVAQGQEPLPAEAPTSALTAALNAPTRTPANVARDKYRHPAETLAFFDVKPGDTVVELWPGGGWYTEVLAPYLANGGKLVAVPPAGSYDKRIRDKIASNPVYGAVEVATFNAGQPTSVAPASADVVLTFRNVHSWLDEKAPIADQVFAEAFRVLKPPASASSRLAKSMPIRRTARIIPTVCGPCRRRFGSATKTARSIWQSARATE